MKDTLLFHTLLLRVTMSEALIHPTAFVDPSARIANDVTVGPFCHIGKNVVLEAGCSVAAHALLNDNVTCKAGVKIFSHVQIGNHRITSYNVCYTKLLRRHGVG